MLKRAATCLSKGYARIDMAKSRKEGSTEKQRNNHRRNHQSATEQTERIGQNAADSSREAAQVGSDLLRRNAETVQTAVRVVSTWPKQRWAARPTTSGWRAIRCKTQPNKRHAAPPQYCTPPRRPSKVSAACLRSISRSCITKSSGMCNA